GNYIVDSTTVRDLFKLAVILVNLVISATPRNRAIHWHFLVCGFNDVIPVVSPQTFFRQK
ncbi:MAG: hypothetical protein AAB353_13625, partial [Candidatus Hydrogenedentota bacterium]